MKNVAVVMMKNENKYIFYIIFHCSWILFYYSNDVKKEWNSFFGFLGIQENP